MSSFLGQPTTADYARHEAQNAADDAHRIERTTGDRQARLERALAAAVYRIDELERRLSAMETR